MMSLLVVVLFLALAFLVALVVERCHVAGFNKRFPPIDDDEFVRRCSPGVNRGIALRVRRIVSDAMGIEYQRVYPEQRFGEDLGC
jgi:hypothetical protein